MGEILADFINPHFDGVALAMKKDKPLNALDVSLFGAEAIMKKSEMAAHAVEQKGLFRHEGNSQDEV
jgi:hypothetical protein